MSTRLSYIVGYFVLALVLWGCANQVPLTGGEKDTTPPKSLLFTPENYSKNFESSTIKVEFDEMIQVRNTSEILVSPYLKTAPKYSASGKNLVIELPEDLEDSVTYTIDFVKSLVDLNEGNPLEGFKYSFSTYDQIDTLVVGGVVRDAFSKEPVSGCLVGLYKKGSMEEVLPLYIALTNDQGTYELSGVREGEYFVRAFEDVNKDKLLQPNELFGFREQKMSVDTTMDSIEVLTSINGGVNPIYNIDYKVNRFPVISSERPISEWDLQYVGGEKIPGILNATRDSFFMTDTLTGSQGVAKVGSVSDTIRFAPPGGKDDREGNISVSLVATKCLGNRILLKSSRALEEVDWEGITLWRDSIQIDSVKKQINARGRIELVFERIEGLESVTVKLDSGALTAGLNSNLKWNTRMPLIQEEQLSRVSFQLKDSLNLGKNYLVYLEDKSGNTLRYVSSKEKLITFNKVQAGEYYVRVVVDQNGDQIWNSVNQELLTLPEPVLLLGPYRVEEGWDLLENVIKLP